jgi:hypothetical protein
MLSPPLSFPFELPSPLPEEGWPWLRSLVARLDQLAGENAELKERLLQQAETIRELRDEIAVLKGQKGRPAMKPSRMDQETDKDKNDPTGGRGRGKRCNTGQPETTARLDIHEERSMAVNDVPEGSRFLGHLPAGAGRTTFRSGPTFLHSVPAPPLPRHAAEAARASVRCWRSSAMAPGSSTSWSTA